MLRKGSDICIAFEVHLRADSKFRSDEPAESTGNPAAHEDREERKEPRDDAKRPKRKRRWWRRIGITLGVIVLLLVCARLALPSVLRWYVNRTIDQNPMYDGKIGDIDVSLWRGAYTIKNIKLDKTTGNVPVPLFAADRVDLAIEWDALRHRKIVGRIVIEKPELNFVDDADESKSQTGASGPWLEMIDDLFPFRINKCEIKEGSIHFRAFHTEPPVDAYIDQLDASIENLSNIRDEVTPMVATVKAKGMAMGHARLNYQMKLDPFSYHPTFQLAIRLVGLDVTTINSVTRGYGSFDFERGFFDLVVEMTAQRGQVEGYVKPLFRNLRVLSLQDVKEDNPVQFFWEALVGFTAGVLSNPPRDQFGTMIPLRGDLTKPSTDILTVVGNVLRNAFIRAYLPRLEGTTPDIDGLEFGRGSVTDQSALDGSQ